VDALTALNPARCLGDEKAAVGERQVTWLQALVNLTGKREFSALLESTDYISASYYLIQVTPQYPMHHPHHCHLSLAALRAWVADGAMAHLGRGFFPFPLSFELLIFSGSKCANVLPELFAQGF
jgi:hypothetical protein